MDFDFEKLLKETPEDYLDFKELGKVIPMNVLEKYIDKPWEKISISKNPNLTMDIVDKYFKSILDYDDLTIHLNFTYEFLQDLYFYNNTAFWFSKNPKLALETVEKYIEKDWDWKYISYHPDLTLGFVKKYSDKEWDHSVIFKRFILTTE